MDNMVEARAAGLVRRFYAAMAAGDVPAVLALASNEVTITQTERLPWGGTFSGKAGLARFADGVRQHIRSEVSLSRLIASGDRVAAIGRTSGTVIASGREFDIALVHLFTIADDGLRSLEVLLDVPDMLAVLE